MFVVLTTLLFGLLIGVNASPLTVTPRCACVLKPGLMVKFVTFNNSFDSEVSLVGITDNAVEVPGFVPPLIGAGATVRAIVLHASGRSAPIVFMYRVKKTGVDVDVAVTLPVIPTSPSMFVSCNESMNCVVEVEYEMPAERYAAEKVRLREEEAQRAQQQADIDFGNRMLFILFSTIIGICVFAGSITYVLTRKRNMKKLESRNHRMRVYGP